MRPGGRRLPRSSPGPHGRRRRLVVSRATVGVIQPRLAAISPPPASRTTVGLPVPLQFRCSRCPPTSTNRPGIETTTRRRGADGLVGAADGGEAHGPDGGVEQPARRPAGQLAMDLHGHPERECEQDRRPDPVDGRVRPSPRGPAGRSRLRRAPAAGTAAQRCGCAVNRVESPARSGPADREAAQDRPRERALGGGHDGCGDEGDGGQEPGATDPATTMAMGGRRRAGEPTGCAEGDGLAGGGATSGWCGSGWSWRAPAGVVRTSGWGTHAPGGVSSVSV